MGWTVFQLLVGAGAGGAAAAGTVKYSDQTPLPEWYYRLEVLVFSAHIIGYGWLGLSLNYLSSASSVTNSLVTSKW